MRAESCTSSTTGHWHSKQPNHSPRPFANHGQEEYMPNYLLRAMVRRGDAELSKNVTIAGRDKTCGSGKLSVVCNITYRTNKQLSSCGESPDPSASILFNAFHAYQMIVTAMAYQLLASHIRITHYVL